VLSLLLASALVACQSGGGSIVPALANATYPFDLVPSGSADLVDGHYQEEAAPGSASMVTVDLGSPTAEGDLDGDGDADAAAVLVVEPGGSGTFTYLAAVSNDDGAPVALGTTLLGDRIVVERLTIVESRIEVDLLTRAPDEPFSSPPTVAETRLFEVTPVGLVAID
jgi:hypothetical protein